MPLRFLLAALAVFCLAITPLRAAPPPTAERQELEQFIHDYLLAHPEVIEDAIRALQTKRDAEAALAQNKAVEENRALIFDSANQAVLGNPKGTVTLVEFFDYNCPYCRRAVPDMTALIESNPDLRMVLKEFPILSEGSVAAARVAIAIQKIAPAKYLAFHDGLMSRPGQADEQSALDVAGKLGLDVDALKAAAAASDVTDNLKEVHQLAQLLGINGTPAYVIGKEVIAGAAGYDALQAKVAAVRDCGNPIC